MDLILKRTYFNDATIGTLSILGKDNPLWHTIELPDLDNKVKESCVPQGIYEVEPYTSPKFKEVWKLKEVEGRTNILFHVGNWASDTDGCILVGMSGGYMHNKGKNEKAVHNSRNAIMQMKNELGYPSSFNLLITS